MIVVERRRSKEAIWCDILNEWVDPTTEEGARMIVDDLDQFMEVCYDLKNIPILLNIFNVFEKIGEEEEFFVRLFHARDVIFSNLGTRPINAKMGVFLYRLSAIPWHEVNFGLLLKEFCRQWSVIFGPEFFSPRLGKRGKDVKRLKKRT